MSLDQRSPAADTPGQSAAGAPTGAEPPPQCAATAVGATAARDWRRVLALLVVIGAAALGLYFGLATWLRKLDAPPARLATRLPPEPIDEAQSERAPAADRPKRLPLDPLVPQSGARLIAEAERVANDLAERFPENPDAHEMLARFQFEFADVEAAATAWRRCLVLNANYAYAHAGLAKVATEHGELDSAVAHWRRAILADPGTAAHQVELGRALLASGEVHEAIAVLTEVVKADPTNSQAHAELGSAHLQKRDDAAAKAAFEQALALDPLLAAAHFGLATACMRLGQVDEAREHEARYTELRADRTQAVRRARRAYDDDRALGEDIARLYTDMGSVYLAAGQAEQAEQLWRRAVRLHAENRACRQALAWLMRQQNKPLESILLFRELARLEPQNVAYPVEMARLFAEIGRARDGQLVLQEFADTAPEIAAGQTALAEFYLRVMKEPGRAVEHAQKAAKLSGAAADWALLSSAHERNGDFAAAIAALERAMDLAPDNLQYRQLLALLKQRADQPAQQTGAAGKLDEQSSEGRPPAVSKAPD